MENARKFAATTDSLKSCRIGRLVACVLLCSGNLVTIGCGNEDPTTVQRVGVSGQVTLDGRPLEAAAIVFHSESSGTFTGNSLGDDALALPAFSFVEDGVYTIDAQDGPTVGTARVEFRPKPIPREELEQAIDQAAKSGNRLPPKTSAVEIPDRYNADSTLRVELVPGENQHNFELTSRP